jgi:hypothetical protein
MKIQREPFSGAMQRILFIGSGQQKKEKRKKRSTKQDMTSKTSHQINFAACIPCKGLT